MQKLVKYIKSPLEEENCEAIKLSGTILSVDNPETVDIFIYNGGINALASHFNDQTSIQKMKEVLWAISNISAGTNDQIRYLIKEEELISNLLKLIDCNSQSIKREVTVVFTNLFTTCTEQEIIL
jgi:hypothetical protein